MPLKIGAINVSDITVRKNSEDISLTSVFAKKNGITTQIWGKRSFIVTVNNYSYISSITYSYKDAGGYTKNGNITATTTFSDVGYDENITITASPATATAQYTYSVDTAGGTYTPSTSSLTITASRTVNKYTITLSSTYGYWTNSGGTTISTISNVEYGTSMSKSGTTLTVGSNTYTFNKNADTAQYSYSDPTIGTVPATLTGNTTISGSATRTLRSYAVTFTNPTYGSWGSTSKTAYYGDTLSVNGYTVTCYEGTSSTTRWTNSCSANASTDQYTYALTSTVSAPSSVDGAESVTGPSSTRTVNKYPVTITAGTGISSVYLSTSSAATSGSASGTNYDYGTTIYGFVIISDGYYTIDSTWTLISGTAYTANAIYRVGSLSVGTSNDFGTKSATRNPYIKITFTNGTATLDGSSITSGTSYYVQYNSSHSVIIDSNSNYYISSSTSTGRTEPTACRMTLNGNTYVYKRNTYAINNITSNQTRSVTSSRYYTYKIQVPTEFGYLLNGNITYSTTSYTKTLPVYSANSNTANEGIIEEYYTGTITPNIWFYSLLIYDSNTTTNPTQDTSHGYVDDNNSIRPYKFNAYKKLIIAQTNATSSVELGSQVITNSDNKYNQVYFGTSKTNTDFTGNVSYANVASAYVTATSWIGSIDLESVSVGETYTISSDRLVVTRLGSLSTQTASLTPVSSTQNVSPTSFTFDAYNSAFLTTTNLTITEAITRVTFPDTTGFEIRNYGSSSYGNYTTYDGTLVNNIPTRMYSSLTSYLSYNEVWINNNWYTLDSLPSNWSYSKTKYTYSGRTYYGYRVTYDTSYEDEGETYGDYCSIFVGTNRSSAGVPGYILTHVDITGMDYPDYTIFTNFRIRVRTS